MNAPFLYWVGMNTAANEPQRALRAFDHFYSHIHLHEVVSKNPGFLRGLRYELIEPASRPSLPQWLAIYELADEESALGYLSREEDGRRPQYSPGPSAWQNKTTVWRLLWQRDASSTTFEESRREREPEIIRLDILGVAARPRDSERKGVTNYELYRGLLYPTLAPRFVAVDQVVGEQTKTQRRPNVEIAPPPEESSSLLYRFIHAWPDSPRDRTDSSK